MCGWAGEGFAGQYLSLRGHFIGSCAGVPGSWGENCFFDCIGQGCKISLILRDSVVETASLAEIEKISILRQDHLQHFQLPVSYMHHHSFQGPKCATGL